MSVYHSYIFSFLENNNISYAIVEDIKIDDLDTNIFKEDLDLVLDCKKSEVFTLLTNMNNFKHLEGNTFLEIDNNLRIDLYFNYINVGYYYYLKVNALDFHKKRINRIDYMIYQIIDPILKFSYYHDRHRHRIDFYFSSLDYDKLRNRLAEIIGGVISNVIINKLLRSDFNFSRYFIKICKFRLLFINGNFVRMLKSRIL